jgi:hypothetical protein
MGAILHDGKLDLYDDLDDAMLHYKQLVDE